MAYKRYFYKNGKVFGPYYYESYRDENGKVRKKYVGLVDPEKNKKDFITPTKNSRKNLWFAVGGLILFISLFFLIFSNLTLTGNVGLNVNSVYLSGENISGDFVLQLQEGELLPANAKFVVEQSGSVSEFLISDLFDSNSQGNFYINGKTFSGTGAGYGVLGKKEIYPELDFELIISDSENSGKRTIPEENFEEIPTSQNSIPADESENSEQTSTETPTGNSQTTENEIVENSREDNNVDSEIPAEENSNEQSGQREIAEQSPENSEPIFSITGAVIEESNNIIKGKCSKENDFVYEIPEGKKVEIKSVELNGKKIDNENVKLKISGNQIIISTDYSENEKGFGEEFLTGKEEKVKIDLEELNLQAKTGEIVIKLIYENEILAEVRQEIQVRKIPEIDDKTPEIIEDKTDNLNKTEIPDNKTPITNKTENKSQEQIPEFNQTINETEIPVNETIIQNETAIIVNETIDLNQTINNTKNITFAKLTLIQYPAIIGMPVKWAKIIDVKKSELSDFAVEIPKSAQNISVKKDKEIEKIEKTEINKEKIEKRIGFSENFTEKLNGARFLETTDKKIIDITEIAVTSEIVAIEYYTEAPKSEESETSNGKQIIISSDELNYTNILAYTFVNDNYKIKIEDTSKLKLYWINKKIKIPTTNLTENYTETDLNQTSVNETLTNETTENQTEIIISNETLSNVNLTNETSFENKTTEIPESNLTESPTTNETIEENLNETFLENNNSLEINETGNFEGSRFITGQVIGGGNSGFLVWLKNLFAKISWGLTGNVISAQEIYEMNETENLQNETNLSEVNPEVVVEEFEKILVNYTAYDLNNDSYVDYIEWIVPHLSNQTYELIIEISKAEHLDSDRTFLENVFEFVKSQDNNFSLIPDRDYLRIKFERPLNNKRDITIYARGGSRFVVVNGVEVPYEIYEKKKRIDEIRKILEGNESA